jgi:uncharacterized protein YfaS (alpha-2-macroglobulin family)
MPRLLAPRWKEIPLYSRALEPVVAASPQPPGDRLMAQIDALRSRQNEQGGFGLWSATPESEPFVSAYAMHFLLEARDRGVPVPKETIDAGNKYLQQLAADDSLDGLDQIRQRAYAVYLLTRQGNVTTNDLASVQKRLEEAYPKVWKSDLAAAWLAASYKLMKQDREAIDLIAPLQRELERTADDEPYVFDYYDDPLIRDDTVLYLLAKHFPDRAQRLSARVLENIIRPLEHNELNTLSAAMTMLALDVYASSNQAAADKLGIDVILSNGVIKPIATPQNKLLQAGSWGGNAKGLRFSDGGALPAWFVVDQEGYDRDVPSKAIKNGLEIVRDYTDAKGNQLGQIALGEEIYVHLKIRATGAKGEGNIAIVDLLPGGFDPVTGFQGDSSTPSVTSAGSSWRPLYTDVREDRVVIYGTATPDVEEFVYRIKASAAGKFIVPPAFGESMYDRRIQARSPGGDVLTVVRAH